jgi:hypothetical protein
MFGLSKDERLESLLKGKNVSLVGPAPYLIDKNRGKEFDGSDIVIRPNEIIPLKHLRKDYGSRTDIYICNFGTPWMDGIKRKIMTDDHNEHFKNLKMVIGSAIRGTHGDNIFASNYVSPIPQNFQSINEYDLPFYWIGIENYKKLYSQIGVEFNTGIASICILLSYPIRSLKVSGFTFYTKGNTYQDLYCEGHMDKQDYGGRSFGYSGGHGSHATMMQINFIKKLFFENRDKVILDDVVSEVLK